MTETITERQASYADRIAKLLRKAEATSGPEADAFYAKAQTLMITYAIDDEMLARARGEQVQDVIVEEHIDYTGIYHAALYDIGASIARSNGCRVLITKNPYDRESGRTISGSRMWVIGYTRDIAQVRLLNASIQLQASRAMASWWRGVSSEYPSSEGYKARRTFLFEFGRELGVRLENARKQGAAEAARLAAERTSEDAAAGAAHYQDIVDAAASVDLVLRGKAERVDDWVDSKYGRRLRRVSRNYASGGLLAGIAGRRAARETDIGQTRVGGGGRQLTT